MVCGDDSVGSVGRWVWSVVAVFVAWSCGLPAQADDWPQWLGPQRDAIWREKGILESFPTGGPPVTWRVPVGPGYAGPAVSGGRVYLLDRQPKLTDEGRLAADKDTALLGTERVLCFNAADGQLVWKHEYECPYRISYPAGPRTTPLVEDHVVYTLGAMGDLLALDADSGKVKWSRQLVQEYHTKPPVWGYACHPFTDGDKLICLAGGEGSAVVALDKHTGKEIWHAVTAQEVGYAPPVIFADNGQRQLIYWHDTAVESLEPETGKILWSVEFPEGGPQMRPAVTIMTPRVAGKSVLVSDFYDGSLMLSLASSPPGATVKWVAGKDDPQNDNGLNVLMATPIIKDGFVYGMAGNGELRCLKADTGEVVWRDLAPTGDRKTFFATSFIVENEDRFFLFNDQGFLIVARMSPTGYQELGRAKLLEPTGFARGRHIVWSHPAFAERSMFARNDKELIRVNLEKTGS